MPDDPKDAKAIPDASPVPPAPVVPAASVDPKAEERPPVEPPRTADEPPAQSKAPDKYTLVVPDAAAAFVEPADLAHLESVARTSNWSNEDAQAALEEYAATIAAQSVRFAAELKADKDYGGDKLAESQQLAKRAIDRVRPDGHARRDAFMRFLNRGGAGNNLEVVSFLADLGKLMSEDTPAPMRSTGSDTGKDAASKLYDHPTSQTVGV